jgi:hypothetical protein
MINEQYTEDEVEAIRAAWSDLYVTSKVRRDVWPQIDLELLADAAADTLNQLELVFPFLLDKSHLD